MESCLTTVLRSSTIFDAHWQNSQMLVSGRCAGNGEMLVFIPFPPNTTLKVVFWPLGAIFSVHPLSFMNLSLTSYLGKSTPLSQLPLDSCPRRSWLRMISLAEFDSLYTHPIRSIVASKLNKTYTFEIEIVCFHLASYFLSLILWWILLAQHTTDWKHRHGRRRTVLASCSARTTRSRPSSSEKRSTWTPSSSGLSPLQSIRWWEASLSGRVSKR